MRTIFIGGFPRRIVLTGVLGAVLGFTGCTVGVSSPPPPPRVVERDVVDQNGYVVERDRYYADPAPPAEVEVIGVAPYPGAIWVHGYWARAGYHRRVWVHGYWR